MAAGVFDETSLVRIPDTMTEPLVYGISSPDELKDVEIWTLDTIENILPHIYRPLEQVKKKKVVSTKPPVPEELYPEPVADLVLTHSLTYSLTHSLTHLLTHH